ncbi:MAG: hypothetical protein J5527_07255 [Treponema sp.]|nr:hypothetical protein [Treponema sp.]
MTEAVLAVDIGTTSLKAALVSATGDVVAFNKASFSAPQNRFVAEGWLWALKSSTDKILKNLANSGSEVSIVAVSISGNGPTIVSDSGFTIRWNEDIEKLIMSDEGFIATKSLFLPKIAAFKLLFPDEFERTDFIYSGPEYLINKLTGTAVTILPEDRFISAYWTSEELEALRISQSKLPPYVKPGESFGNLAEEAAEFLGLKSGIPVFGCGPDFVAALVGTNTLSAGKLCDRSGSSEGFNFCSDNPIIAEGLRTLPSIIPGLWNVSYIIPKSSSLTPEERLSAVEEAVGKLKKALADNGISFPEEITVTGGQTNDVGYMKKKEQRLGVKLKVCKCSDSELIGDACAAWYGLGKFGSLQEAADSLCK